MAKQILGKVVPIARGTYNSSTQYAILDIVEYNGSSYIAKTNVQGQAPTNTTYWQLLAKQGDKPVYKVDYLTDAEMAEIVNDIITDSTNAFNQNVTAKTTAFNNNATDKTSAFNSNATSKTNDFNSNATSKTTAFNSNAIDKTSDYNTNASSTKDDFDRNASSKTTTFNDNATSKTNSYNSNATDKTTAYNNNHTDKLGAYNDNASAKTTAFNDNYDNKIDLFDAHSEELQEEVSRYKTLENSLPHINGTGESITLNDTANSPLWLNLKPADLQQISATNKNLLDYTLSSIKSSNTSGTWSNNIYTINNLSYEILDDLTIKINGTANDTTDFTVNENLHFAIGNYKLCGTPSTGGSAVYKQQLVGVGSTVNESGTGQEFTTAQAYSSAKLTIKVYNGQALSDVVFKPMVTTDTSLSYDDYVYPTGGYGTPTVDYPQTIHTITGDNQITVASKNLINNTLKNGIKNGIAYIVNPDKTIVLNGTATADTDITIATVDLPAGHYTITGSPLQASAGTYKLQVVNVGSTQSETGNGTSFETLIEYPNVNVNIKVYNGQTLNDVVFKPMLRLYTDDNNTYAPYGKQTADLELGTLEYCKLGIYEDRFFKNIPEDADYDALRESGKWYLKKNVGKIASYDSETITTLYKSTTGGLNEGATVYYGLTTPVYTSLSADLQAQLENIYNRLLSYQVETNISQENDDLAFNIKAKAVYDLNKLVDRVATLETE